MKNEYVNFLVEKYRRKGVIIDSNLLVLLVVGFYDQDRIQDFRRTRKYNKAIYALVSQIVGNFARRYVTPNIATEMDNLSRQVAENELSGISLAVQSVLASSEELSYPSIALATHELHADIGLTDCSILIASSADLLVLTDDLPLSATLGKLGRDVINVNHLLL